MPAAYLLRRNNIYYYRRRIPADCRAVFKKRELIFSLRTTRRYQALRMLVDCKRPRIDTYQFTR
jgi:hypothetical protein